MTKSPLITKKNILVLAYSVSPVRGSEYSVGWNYINELSSDNNLIVLYGAAGNHMGDIGEVKFSPICQSMSNVRFVAIEPDPVTQVLNFFNRRGMLKFSFYFAYRLWHRKAYQVARRITESESIDLIHYLGMIGYREPGFLWKLDKPYIWGPIGGVENRPAKIILESGVLRGFKSIVRNFVNTIQFAYSPNVKAALERANLVLAINSGTCKLLRSVHGIDAIPLPENAITSDMLSNQRQINSSSEEDLILIWVGRVDENKSLDILISALARVKKTNWHLYVIGDGPLLDQNKKLSCRFNIQLKITWVGFLPRSEIDRYYKKAHIHVITSMMEGNPTTLWEAMSFGVPTITLDHCGMHDTVCEKCGVKIPLSSYSEIVENYAKNIESFVSDRGLISRLSSGVVQCSQEFTWRERKKVWQNLYDVAEADWQARRTHGNSNV